MYLHDTPAKNRVIKIGIVSMFSFYVFNPIYCYDLTHWPMPNHHIIEENWDPETVLSYDLIMFKGRQSVLFYLKVPMWRASKWDTETVRIHYMMPCTDRQSPLFYMEVPCGRPRGGQQHTPDSKVHGANMGPTWVLSAPDGPHAGPMNLASRDDTCNSLR